MQISNICLAFRRKRGRRNEMCRQNPITACSAFTVVYVDIGFAPEREFSTEMKRGNILFQRIRKCGKDESLVTVFPSFQSLPHSCPVDSAQIEATSRWLFNETRYSPSSKMCNSIRNFMSRNISSNWIKFFFEVGVIWVKPEII